MDVFRIHGIAQHELVGITGLTKRMEMRVMNSSNEFLYARFYAMLFQFPYENITRYFISLSPVCKRTSILPT